jgi:hypothetical protein
MELTENGNHWGINRHWGGLLFPFVCYPLVSERYFVGRKPELREWDKGQKELENAITSKQRIEHALSE